MANLRQNPNLRTIAIGILSFPLISIFFSFGCGSDTLPKVQYVDNLRVLAISNTPIQVRFGNTVTATALIADPKGGGRTLTYKWSVCTVAQSDQDYTNCRTSIVNSEQTTTSLTPSFTYTNSITTATQMLLTLAVSAGQESRSATKQFLIVPSSYEEPSAPSISNIVFTGEASSYTGTFYGNKNNRYTAEATLSGLRSDYMNTTFVTWITDVGEWDNSRTIWPNLLNQIYFSNNSSTGTVYTIVNDNAGGVGFTQRSVNIQ